MAEIHYSRELLALFSSRPGLQPRIEQVVDGYFPEVRKVSFGRASRSAYYDPRSGVIRINSGCSLYIIGHEITHYLQDRSHYPGGALYPGGERAADLFLFARSPDVVTNVWETNDASYLLKAVTRIHLREHFNKDEGQQMIHEVCSEAVRHREAGKCNYINWAEREINARVTGRATACEHLKR